MYFLRTCGDILHLTGVLILLYKILRQRSVAGVSLKSMFLFALVFTTRYLDLFFYFLGLYNFVMKLLFLASSYHICYLAKFKSPWKNTYDRAADSFRIEFLIAPCAVLAIILSFTHRFSFLELLWEFSQLLESVAILPQIYLLENTDRYDVLTTHYLLCLGLYRLFYIFHWIRLWNRIKKISFFCGVLQTVLYGDFFYQYFKIVVSRVENRVLD